MNSYDNNITIEELEEYDSENSLLSLDDTILSNGDCFIYDAEEESNTKYNIVICSAYNTDNHGELDDEDADIIPHHYITDCRIKQLNDYVYRLREEIFPNASIEIAQCIYLPSFYCISILKTYWIRIIQRTWRNVMNKRKYIIQRRKQIGSIKYKELHGKWPDDCLRYPTLQGMLM
jgi:hypothetical protein